MGKANKLLVEKYKLSLENMKKLERTRYDKLAETFTKFQEDAKQQSKKEKELQAELEYLKKACQQQEETVAGLNNQIKEKEQKNKELQRSLGEANEGKN